MLQDSTNKAVCKTPSAQPHQLSSLHPSTLPNLHNGSCARHCRAKSRTNQASGVPIGRGKAWCQIDTWQAKATMPPLSATKSSLVRRIRAPSPRPEHWQAANNERRLLDPDLDDYSDADTVYLGLVSRTVWISSDTSGFRKLQNLKCNVEATVKYALAITRMSA